MSDILQQNRFARARLGDDQGALAFPERGDDIDHARREVLDGGVFDLHPEPLGGIKRRQVVEVHLVALFLGILEVDFVDLQQRKVAFTFFRAANLPFHRIPERKAKRRICEGET